MRKTGRIPALLLCAMLAAGCDPGADQPTEPVWGKQPCEQCAMLLSDRQHGAQLVTAEGDRLYFDELGCMVAWTLEHPGKAQHQWVRTSDTQKWLAPAQAGYRPIKHTPMGFGVLAVEGPDALDWPQVVELVREKLQSGGAR